jgi:alpha-glucoside transport system permease protein
MTAVGGTRQLTAVEGQSRIPKPLRRVGVHFIVILLMIIWLLPTVGLLINSFRHATDVTSTGWWVPSEYTLENYNAILNQSNLFDAFINSLFITIPATIIPILVAAFAAYAFSWMNFRGRNWLFIFVVGLLVVPLQMTLIPILKLYAGANLNGQFLAVWLAHTGYGLPFAIYLLRNFMGSLPREVFESAYIDGASPVTAFFRLALPMSVPAIAALAIFQFLFVWNDLLVAITYIGATNSENLPLTGFVSNLVSSTGAGWELLGSAAFLSMALPLIVFFALQRYFVRGITGGAVKG